jgi:hypothetical protein
VQVVSTAENKQEVKRPSLIALRWHCLETAEEHLKKYLSKHRRDWDVKLLIFLLVVLGVGTKE